MNKIRTAGRIDNIPICFGISAEKVADGFVHDARAKPADSSPICINKMVAAKSANANLVINGVVHKNTADGSASRGHSRLVGEV